MCVGHGHAAAEEFFWLDSNAHDGRVIRRTRQITTARTSSTPSTPTFVLFAFTRWLHVQVTQAQTHAMLPAPSESQTPHTFQVPHTYHRPLPTLRILPIRATHRVGILLSHLGNK